MSSHFVITAGRIVGEIGSDGRDTLGDTGGDDTNLFATSSTVSLTL